MLKIWLVVCFFEIFKLWNLGLSVINMAKVLFVFFILAIPISIMILKIGYAHIRKNFSSIKLRLLMGVAMLWMILSAYLVNQNIVQIVKLINRLLRNLI